MRATLQTQGQMPFKARSVLRFIRLHRRWHWMTATAVFALFFFLITGVAWFKGELGDVFWTWGYWEPITGMTILIFAVLLWLGESTQDWENSLPKRVTAVFLHPRQQGCQDSKIALICEEAYLAGENDLRQWSQQLGTQVADTKELLKFEPFIRQINDGIRCINGKDFKHYVTVFRLTDLPKSTNASTNTVLGQGGAVCGRMGTDGGFEKVSLPEGLLLRPSEEQFETMPPS